MIKKYFKNYSIGFIVLIFFPFSGYCNEIPLEFEKILNQEVVNNNMVSTDKGSLVNLRNDAIYESVYAYSFQKGFSYYNNILLEDLEKIDAKLHKIFDFSFVSYDNMLILPPVLEKSNKNFEVLNDSKAVASDVSFKIAKKARLIAKPASWRDYLYKKYEKAIAIDKALYPVTAQEKEIWDNAAEKGWEDGRSYSKEIFAINLSKLKRDYRGMLLFKKLEKMNMISRPIVTKGEYNIKVGDTFLDVNQKVFTITMPSFFNQEVQKWKPKVGSQQNR